MADIFDVIADGTRREILSILLARSSSGGSGTSVSQIVHELGVSQPTVSKHLKVLREAELVTVRDLIYHGNAHQIHRLISQVRDGVEHEGHGVQFECSLLNELLRRKVPNLQALERQPEPYDPDGGSTPLPRSNTYDGKLKNERAAMVVIDETESRGTDLQHTSSSPSRLPPQMDTGKAGEGQAHEKMMATAFAVSLLPCPPWAC